MKNNTTLWQTIFSTYFTSSFGGLVNHATTQNTFFNLEEFCFLENSKDFFSTNKTSAAPMAAVTSAHHSVIGLSLRWCVFVPRFPRP